MAKLSEDGTIQRWQNNVKYALDMVGGAFAKLGAIGEQTWNYITYLGAEFYAKNKPIFDQMKQVMGHVFDILQTNAGPILGYITNVLLPSLINTLFSVGQKVLDVANYFMDNWSWIGPLVEGIAISLGIYLTYLGLVKAMTITATAMQWLWNAAMTANPIGLVIVGIGLLIGAGILLYRNWDMVKQGASDMWIGIENAFKTGVNKAIGWLNYLIDAANNIPGIDIGHVETLQMGQTSVQKQASFDAVRGVDGSFANGLSYVPFDGFKAELHKGERILTAAESRELNSGLLDTTFQQNRSGENAAPNDVREDRILTAGESGELSSGILNNTFQRNLSEENTASNSARGGRSVFAGASQELDAGLFNNTFQQNREEENPTPSAGRGERILTASESRDLNSSTKNSGTKNSGTKSSPISKLADKIEITITDADKKDSKTMAGEILNHLHDMLKAADAILGSSDMGVLL